MERSAEPSADLSLSGEAEQSVGDLQLHLIVSNAGPDAAESLDLVVFNYMEALTFMDADAPGWTCAETSTGVTCERPSLAAGGSSEVALRFSVTPPPDPFTNFTLVRVYLTSATPDPAPNTPLAIWVFLPGSSCFLPLVSAR
jgi:hypothetical protein